MTFTYAASPPTGSLADIDVALWHARNRSEDTDEDDARPDEAWYQVLEEGAAVVVRVPDTELTKRYPVVVGQVMYRPYVAAAAHIRWIIYKLESAGRTKFGPLEESAARLEAYQLSLDTAYGLVGAVASGDNVRSTPLVRG